MRIFKTKSIAKPLYLSFTIFFFIVLTAGFIVSNLALKRSGENNRLSGERLLSITKYSVHDCFNTAFSTASSIAANPEFANAAKQTDIDGRQYLVLTRFIRDYISSNTTNNIISNIYVYFNNTDRIISSSSMSVEPELFGYTLPGSGTQINFNTVFNTLSPGKLYPFYNRATDRNSILYTYSMLTQDSGRVLGSIAIEINREAVLKCIGGNNDYIFTVINPSDNTILFANTDFDVPYNNIYSDISYVPQSKEHHGTVIINTLSAKAKNLCYAYIIPKSVYFSSINTLLVWIIILMAAFVLFFAVAVIYSVRFGYNPIMDLIDKVSETSPDTLYSSGMNEIDYLNEEFQRHSLSEKSMYKTINAQEQALLNQKVLLVLHGSSKCDIKSLFSSDAEDMFFVMLISVHNTDIHQQAITPVNDWTLYRYAILNMLSELTEKDFEIRSADLDNYTIPIIVKIKCADTDIKPELTAILSDMFEITRREFNIHLSVSISDTFTADKNVHTFYTQVLEGLNYKQNEDTDQIIFYDDIKTANHELLNYYYPIDVENKLINCILTGNTNEARDLYNNIIDVNFRKFKINNMLARCLYYDILATSLKIMREFSKSNSELHLPHIKQDSTVEEIKSAILLLTNSVIDLCEKINESSQLKSSTSNIIIYIEEYVKNHLDDYNLGVNTISDSLGLSPQYISTLFHQVKKQKLSHYIASARIEKAKILLTKTNMSLAQIANSLGYSSDISFSRLFKKFEGVPPRQYKDVNNP